MGRRTETHDHVQFEVKVKDGEVEVKTQKTGLNETVQREFSCRRKNLWEQTEEEDGITLMFGLEELVEMTRQTHSLWIVATEELSMGVSRVLVYDRFIDEYIEMKNVTKQQLARENGLDIVDRGELEIEDVKVEYCEYRDDEELEEEVEEYGLELHGENHEFDMRNGNLVKDSVEEYYEVSYSLV